MTNDRIARALRIASAALMMTVALAATGSAQSRRYGTGITVFTNPDFRGQSASFRNDTPDLRGYGLNDKVSSLEIADGESWELCQDINFANRCQVFSGSVSNLRDVGWNDRISSLRRVNSAYNNRRNGGFGLPNESNGALVLYDRPFYRGSSTVVNNDSNAGLGNSLGSAQVRGGAWQLCDRNGRCATLTQDVPDLSRLGLMGRVTSARQLNGSQVNGAATRSRRWGR